MCDPIYHVFIKKIFIWNTNLKELNSKVSPKVSIHASRTFSAKWPVELRFAFIYTRRNRVHEVERKRPNSADFTKTDISALVKAKHVEKYEMRTRICTILDILKFWTLFSSREGD